jgi:muramidase (phage lysozyme)
MSKKGVSAISGNISPIVGEKQTYHIAGWYPDTPKEERDPANVTWELFRKRSNGKFSTTNIKKKGDSSFTFGEASLGNTYRLEAYLHRPEGGGLIITPKPNRTPQINKVELFYVDDTKGSTFSFMEKLRARAYCCNMFNKELVFTLWEDDAIGSGHHKNNKAIDSQKAKVNKNGIAVAEFTLTKALMKKAMQGEVDSKQLEFYVTVEYYKSKKHATENVEIDNPYAQYYKPKPYESPVTPKAKGSPAEQKPKSRKEEKGILDVITGQLTDLWDWQESMGTITKDKAPTVRKPEGRSVVVVSELKQKKKEETEKVCECEAKVRAFIRMIRVGEGTGELIKSVKYDKETKKNETIYIYHNFQSGYTTAFGGNKINDLSTHPQKNYGGSTAAGAYQVMRYTWWWLNGEELDENNKKKGIYNKDHDYIKKYKISDFSAESQDKICIALMKAQRPNLVSKIIKGEIEDAIKNDACFIWASLPENNDKSHYKYKGDLQPATPLKVCIEHYNKFLKDELADISPLHLKQGFLRDFGYDCCTGFDNIIQTTSIKSCKYCQEDHYDLTDQIKWQTQFDSKWGDEKAQNVACKKTCDDILNKAGLASTSKNEEDKFQTALENKDHNLIIVDVPVAKQAVEYINEQLKNRKPIQVGVDHALNYKGGRLNEGTTDHFIVIIGKGCDNGKTYFRFYDVATRYKDKGANKNNKLFLGNDYSLKGTTVYNGQTYIVSQVRKNKMK